MAMKEEQEHEFDYKIWVRAGDKEVAKELLEEQLDSMYRNGAISDYDGPL